MTITFGQNDLHLLPEGAAHVDVDLRLAGPRQPHRVHDFPVDAEVARCFARIKAAAKRRGHACSDLEFIIAATAKAHGLILATLNYRHFASIEGLAVEDWLKD
jgi:predicted nucleic acid-binding protein